VLKSKMLMAAAGSSGDIPAFYVVSEQGLLPNDAPGESYQRTSNPKTFPGITINSTQGSYSNLYAIGFAASTQLSYSGVKNSAGNIITPLASGTSTLGSSVAVDPVETGTYSFYAENDASAGGFFATEHGSALTVFNVQNSSKTYTTLDLNAYTSNTIFTVSGVSKHDVFVVVQTLTTDFSGFTEPSGILNDSLANQVFNKNTSTGGDATGYSVGLYYATTSGNLTVQSTSSATASNPVYIIHFY